MGLRGKGRAFDGLIPVGTRGFTGHLSMELQEDPRCIACMKREREVLRSGMLVVDSMALDVLITRSLWVCKSMGSQKETGPDAYGEGTEETKLHEQ